MHVVECAYGSPQLCGQVLQGRRTPHQPRGVEAQGQGPHQHPPAQRALHPLRIALQRLRERGGSGGGVVGSGGGEEGVQGGGQGPQHRQRVLRAPHAQQQQEGSAVIKGLIHVLLPAGGGLRQGDLSLQEALANELRHPHPLLGPGLGSGPAVSPPAATLEEHIDEAAVGDQEPPTAPGEILKCREITQVSM